MFCVIEAWMPRIEAWMPSMLMETIPGERFSATPK
jgi:hypothetical protein